MAAGANAGPHCGWSTPWTEGGGGCCYASRGAAAFTTPSTDMASSCFKRRLEDTMAAERHKKECAMVEHVRAEARALGCAVKAMKTYPQVEAFIDMLKPDATMSRRPILAIIGGTNLGKSMLAAHILQRVAVVLGLPVRDGEHSYLEVTVEQNEHLDLAEFDVRLHSGVLLDGVGDALILNKKREALQGRAKLAKGAQSATMIYSYKYTLARRAVVATFDLSAKNLSALANDHWLRNAFNVAQLRLDASVVQVAQFGTICKRRSKKQVPYMWLFQKSQYKRVLQSWA